MNNDSQAYTQDYSDDAFWGKIKNYARKAGKGVLEPALKMYFALNDKDTPRWAKSTIIGALGYFISPLDSIPDLLPVVGYTDDVAILVAALATVSVYIKEEHKEKARQVLHKWLG